MPLSPYYTMPERSGNPIGYAYDDGGRELAGYKGFAGDCVPRAIAIALRLPYAQVYNELAPLNKAYYEKKAKYARRPRAKEIFEKRAVKSARSGSPTPVIHDYLASKGWHYVQLTEFGASPARLSEVPRTGRLILNMRKHLVADIDGTLRDTYDSSYEYDRPVFGYWEASA